jgi:hypothetical protein
MFAINVKSFLILYSDLIGNYDGLNAKLNFKDVRVIVGDHDLTIHDEYEEMFHIEYIVKHWNYSGKMFCFP